MLTRTEIVKLFRYNKPKTAKEARNIGLSLNHLGSGAFREAYVINKPDVNNRLVVKFPIIGRSKYDNLEHAQHEISMIRKINRTQKLAALRPFLPAMHYADFRHGVLLTDYYYRLGASKTVLVSKVLELVSSAIFGELDENYSDGYGYGSRDIAGWNIMQTKEGEFKLIDLGLM